MCAVQYKDRSSSDRKHRDAPKLHLEQRASPSLVDGRSHRSGVVIQSVLKDARANLHPLAVARPSLPTDSAKTFKMLENNLPIQRKTEINYVGQNLRYWASGSKYKQIHVGKKAEAYLDPWDARTGSRTASAPDPSPYTNGLWPTLYQGHLLNANLGGQAISQNLFPVTPAFNNLHSTLVENQVKYSLLKLYEGGGGSSKNTDEANRRVYYSVEVGNAQIGDMKPADLGKTIFSCTAYFTNKGASQGAGVGQDTALPHLKVDVNVPSPPDDQSLNENLANLGWQPEKLPTYTLGDVVKYNTDGTALYKVNKPSGLLGGSVEVNGMYITM